MPKPGNHCTAWRSSWVHHSSAWRNIVIWVICSSDHLKTFKASTELSSARHRAWDKQLSPSDNVHRLFPKSSLRPRQHHHPGCAYTACCSPAQVRVSRRDSWPGSTSASVTLQLHQLQPDYWHKSNVSPVELPKPKLDSVIQEYPLQLISFSTSCCLCFLPGFAVHVPTNPLLQYQEKFIFVNFPRSLKNSSQDLKMVWLI